MCQKRMRVSTVAAVFRHAETVDLTGFAPSL
jgi:hypothetical protein